ncbi:MAG: UDP-N-acetylmuramoyl-tripeptide--D-alanyl-D-alanine ligase [Flavipsychrobacter sp.]|nr:UDP-N-acetylmuramoyl-tripeptide--D-alanyl-D-alanine ligase [Flavipsychrobacter sp.]
MEISALYQIYLSYPSVQTDTRKLKEGDIYFALKGPSFDGNTFALQALEAGAAYAVVDDIRYAQNDKCIVVPDVLETLQQLARYHRMQFQIPFIAITGSNGKTTTKELVTAVLSSKYKVYATEGNLNNHIGVPLTLLKIKTDAEFAVIEMGANHQKEIEGYCKIALPTHGIITNSGKAHIEGFGGIEGVRKGKGELYDYIRATNGTIFRNTDLDYLKGMAAGINRQVTYGSANATYIGQPILSGVFLKVAVLTSHAEAMLDTQLVGAYNFSNVMVAAAVGLHFGVGIDTMKTAIAAYNPDNSRSQWLKKGSNSVILDAYNANPTSMEAAITNFAKMELPHKMLWIGGMKEMGADEQLEHAALVALIGKYDWQDVLLVGPEFKTIQTTYKWFADSAAAAEYIRQQRPANSSILIKGSRGSKMEVLLAAIPEA